MTDQPHDRRSANEGSDGVYEHCQSETLTSDLLTLEVSRLSDLEREALRSVFYLESDETDAGTPDDRTPPV